MRRLPDRRLYSSVDHCLAFLRGLPERPPPSGDPLPVHFYWDGPDWGAKPALCLRSFLATQDGRRVRPWLWLADPEALTTRFSNPQLAPLLPFIEVRRFEYEDLAEGTPLSEQSSSFGRKPAAASDLARLLCTYRHGGCYSDLDALFLRDLGPLFGLVGESEFCFQWSNRPWATNAFCRHQQGSEIVRHLLARARAAGAGHPAALLPFESAPPDLLMLPVAAFSPFWLVKDGRDSSAFSRMRGFEDFFAKIPPEDPRRATLDTFFPGAFTYHWHGQWRAGEHVSSWAGHLAEDIRLRLLKKLPAAAEGSRFGA